MDSEQFVIFEENISGELSEVEQGGPQESGGMIKEY